MAINEVLVKKYPPSILENNSSSGIELSRWLLRGGLHFNRDFFEPSAKVVEDYIAQIQPPVLNFQSIDSEVAGLFKDKLTRNQPIVWLLTNAGLGDNLLLVPAIHSLARVCREAGIETVSYVNTPKPVEKIMAGILEETPGIKVGGADDHLDGIFLYWKKHGLENQLSLQSFTSLYLDSNFFDLKRYDRPFTLAQLTADKVSVLFGLSSLNDQFKTPVSKKVISEESQQSEKYIVIIPQGGVASKTLTIESHELLAEGLYSICNRRNYEVVMIVSPENGNSEWLNPYRNRGIRANLFTHTDWVESSISVIMNSKGVIGVDTFLTHAAELFSPDLPVLALHTISNDKKYRLNPESEKNRIITVCHPLVDQAEQDGITYFLRTGRLYQQVVNFFDVSRNNFPDLHPLTRLFQEEFANRLENGLEQFTQLVLGG